jgi:hypothetical protein
MRGRLTLVLLLAAALGGGCAGPSSSARPGARGGGATTGPAGAADRQSAPLSNTDPCATRLHDLCGPLLLYYAVNHKLPQSLDDLRSTGMDVPADLTCPVSHRPYVYNPAGLLAPNGQGKMIIYDATPAHSHLRWAIAILEPQRSNAPLIAKVIAAPNSAFPL